MKWNTHFNKREMPWKGEKDPYKIWLSEIILQQTRVEQGWKYYENFIQTFPDIQSLAMENDEIVFKLWEGLGYYNRCKNLLHTARFITKENEGIFPDTYEEIIALKGIGPYTAAAICSFAYNQPYAVVDGNVFRVLSRFFGKDIPVDNNEGKKYFTQLAEQVLDKKQPGIYNQAIMDFGATVCKPSSPLCADCLLNKKCFAFSHGVVNHLPVKEKKIWKKLRYLTWFVMMANGKTLINKRETYDVWQNLYEFYLIEKEDKPEWNIDGVNNFCENILIASPIKISFTGKAEQQLTHQKIKAEIIEVHFSAIPDTLKHYQWIKENKLKELAFPKILADYLKHRATIK